jgi:hypothetical protein
VDNQKYAADQDGGNGRLEHRRALRQQKYRRHANG